MASEQEYHQNDDLNDYSCYITIDNKSDSDLLLSDFGVTAPYGVWPMYQPLNTIEARSTDRVHLKDPKVRGGSEGWVQYDVKVGDQIEQFRLKFADPQSPWSDNYLDQWSSNSNRLKVRVMKYKTSGHPFYGQVEVSTDPNAMAEENPKPCPWNLESEASQPVKGDDVRAKFEIGFDWPGPGQKYPVHESIAIAAFIRSMVVFPKATTYNNLNRKQWEYFRGMIWNDDPSCLLFEKSEYDNRAFGVGADWYNEFLRGPANCMTQRSHYGNLQSLHAMGLKEKDEPQDTRTQILNWMGVMYKLACGNQGVSEHQSLRDHFAKEMFNDTTDPSGGATLRDLILATRPEYRNSSISLRALGICMHMIQDSFAVGHVQRRLKNPQDFIGRDPNGYLNFKPGTWGAWGAIVSFHTYGTQNRDRHSFYDGLEGADLPNPRDLNTYNRLHGARDAIEACIVLINAYAQKQKWEDLKQKLENSVFAIDPKAKSCNSAVDEKIPGLNSESASADALDVNVNEEITAYDFGGDHYGYDPYQAGLARKLSTLEYGLPAANVVHGLERGCCWAWFRKNICTACVLVSSLLLMVGFLVRVLPARV